MEKKYISEKPKTLEVLDEPDVLVLGSGVSGCAAAVSAARAGAKTYLIERNGCLGGVATASFMGNIGRRYLQPDGKQVIKGFSGELVDHMVSQGFASPNWRAPNVPGVIFDSERLKVLLIEMLQEAGVTVLTHALAVEPILSGDCVEGVSIESKSGRQAILSKAVVDATGELDIISRSGAKIRPVEKLHYATGSILFRIGRVDLERFVRFLSEAPQDLPKGVDTVKNGETILATWRDYGILFMPHGGGSEWRFIQDAIKEGRLKNKIDKAHSLDALGMYALKGRDSILINSNFYPIHDLDIRKLSSYELHAQRMCCYIGDFLIKNVPGFENGYISGIGTDLGVRYSLRIAGRKTLSGERADGADSATYADDAVGMRPVSDYGLASGEPYRNFTCDIPFGILVPTGVKNILVGSGKSVDTEPPGVIRGMATCMVCGQAAGVASALGAKMNMNSQDVPIRVLQKELLNQGVYLGTEERLKELGLQ